MRTKFTLVLFLFCYAISPLLAQTEGAAFTLTGMGVSTPFARDYQTLGINPANLDLLPDYEKTVTMGFAEIGASLYAEALGKKEIRQNIFGQDAPKLTQQQKLDYAVQFSNSKNAVDFDAMSFGISVRTKSLGTYAFSTKERFDFYSSLGTEISQLLWLGATAPYFDSLVVDLGNGNFDTIANSNNLDPNTYSQVVKGFTPLSQAQTLSQLLKGSSLRFSWMREFNLGWGKKIIGNDTWELHAGIGAKLLIGQGILIVDGEREGVSAFSALSPVFGVDYGNIANVNPSSLDANAPKFSPVGKGFGVDIGATFILKQKLTISASVTDIGSMTWDGNVYELRDVNLTELKGKGIESTNFLEQAQQFNGSDGLLAWQGAESLKTKLPTTIRLGVGYTPSPKLRVGVDIVTPMNSEAGNIDKAVIALGGEFSPVKWIHLQAGVVQGGNYDLKIPVGAYFTIGKGTYECGIASRDLVTFFSKNQATVSMATGFLRFRF
jgi:Family of unknown function (DUF5723)